MKKITSSVSRSYVRFDPVAPGASACLPHGLPRTPDVVSIPGQGRPKFMFSVDAKNITVTNYCRAWRRVVVIAELWDQSDA